jgi:hypothetical protein
LIYRVEKRPCRSRLYFGVRDEGQFGSGTTLLEDMLKFRLALVAEHRA